jgi:hypothetical protein
MASLSNHSSGDSNCLAVTVSIASLAKSPPLRAFVRALHEVIPLWRTLPSSGIFYSQLETSSQWIR